MIPFVLSDGRISFLAIQVKCINRLWVDDAITKACKKFKFSGMFGTEQEDDRHYGLVVLALGNYGSLEAKVVANTSPLAECQTASNSPAVLVIKGIPSKSAILESIFDAAPTGESYRGISHVCLEKCDKMLELIHELDSEPESKASLGPPQNLEYFEQKVQAASPWDSPSVSDLSLDEGAGPSKRLRLDA